MIVRQQHFDMVAVAFERVKQRLLAERNEQGHWDGQLSTSALSTATAVMALQLMNRHHDVDRTTPQTPVGRDAEQIERGLRWLAEHQNADGGWGDTVKSFSNISTTMLCHAVFHATASKARYATQVRQASAYIDHAGGVPAVVARYGKDKTFSVPILTHCALAGLVDWKTIPALPFELACLPAQFYKTVRLPVVSYALPALIAIGQVRQHFAPTRNPFVFIPRNLARSRSLKVLERIQPENGGFLEATPLTSFVTMSLAGMGLANHPVAQKGRDFILASARDDGSWPIDTNLATWVTTLSVNALGNDLPEDARLSIRNWLLEQQYRHVHPYTNADPGGWSWTDLPGGVPDADDTPGAVLALSQVANTNDTEAAEAQHRAIHWLMSLQNRDGGFPTFCRGWGTLPFDRSSPDITAHCLRALLELLPLNLRGHVSTLAAGNAPKIKLRIAAPWPRVLSSLRRGFRFLAKRQLADGSWLPLWFGNQHAKSDINPTYGTAKVLAAFRSAESLSSESARRGVKWLVDNQNDDGGWGGVKGTPSSPEETALAAEILLSSATGQAPGWRGIEWLCDRVTDDSWHEPTPIGFYFAKLWYFERLYPQIFVAAALRRAVSSADNRS